VIGEVKIDKGMGVEVDFLWLSKKDGV